MISFIAVWPLCKKITRILVSSKFFAFYGKQRYDIFFDKQIFRVRVYIKEIQARARAGLCTWRYWVVMCVVEFLVLLIFFVVVTFGFAGCCAPGIGFSQKSCKNIWKLR